MSRQDPILKLTDSFGRTVEFNVDEMEKMFEGQEETLAISDLEEKYGQSHLSYSNVKSTLVGLPLYFLGDLVLKNLFAYTIGFHWLVSLLSKLDWKYYKLSLPTVSYVVTTRGVFVGSILSQFISENDNCMVSGFSLGTNNYHINFANAILIPFDYLSRNIGKWLGYLIASPWTVPTYLLLKGGYSLHQRYIDHQITSHLEKADPVDLARDYFDHHKVSDKKRLCQYVNAAEYASSLLQYFNTPDSILVKHDEFLNFGPATKIPEQKRKNAALYTPQFSKTREKAMKNKLNNQRWKIALYAVLLTPFSLFFTIPKYNELRLEFKREKELLDYNNEYMPKIASGEMTIYDAGKELLDKAQDDFAFIYLKEVPESSKNYKEAMSLCGDYLLANGQNEAANEYFSKAEDKNGISISSSLHQNKNPFVEIQKSNQTNKNEFEPLLPTHNSKRQDPSAKASCLSGLYSLFQKPNTGLGSGTTTMQNSSSRQYPK